MRREEDGLLLFAGPEKLRPLPVGTGRHLPEACAVHGRCRDGAGARGCWAGEPGCPGIPPASRHRPLPSCEVYPPKASSVPPPAR